MPCPTSTATADRGGAAEWVGHTWHGHSTGSGGIDALRHHGRPTAGTYPLSRLDAAPQGRSSAAQSSDVAGRVDLNTANQPALESLPGIGPKTAELIIEYRKETGGFKKVEELMNIKGIGEKTFLRLRELVSIDNAGVRK